MTFPPTQLASCRSLCFLLGDSNVSEGLNELLPTCWSACFKLVEDVQDFESKVRFLETLICTSSTTCTKINSICQESLSSS